ncbi:MAG: hypothetical protein IJ224_02980 [Lachnospiraceae bacterium]|nr:hypothetical protein [Lachnospiraceae bacterium]
MDDTKREKYYELLEKILRNNNCSIAQWFFFDRPLPVEEFEKRFEDNKYINLVNE